jgi:hypothetical protein
MVLAELTLPFLGQRTYLHGTTLFDELRRHATSDAVLSFKISHRIESNRVRFIDLSHDDTPSNPAATLDWKGREARGSIGVIPLSPQFPIERRPYDESLVTRSLSVKGEDATFVGIPPFTLVAMLVPTFKIVLRNVHRSSDQGQWMFTRLDLDHFPPSYTTLGLRLDRVLGGTLAKAHVIIDGTAAGAIYYSWV